MLCSKWCWIHQADIPNILWFWIHHRSTCYPIWFDDQSCFESNQIALLNGLNKKRWRRGNILNKILGPRRVYCCKFYSEHWKWRGKSWFRQGKEQLKWWKKDRRQEIVFQQANLWGWPGQHFLYWISETITIK